MYTRHIALDHRIILSHYAFGLDGRRRGGQVPVAPGCLCSAFVLIPTAAVCVFVSGVLCSRGGSVDYPSV